MKFRTPIEIQKSDINIQYGDNLLFLGSCFSDNVGIKFKNLFFKPLINPFGVLYNPFSIKNNIENLIVEKKYNENDLFFHNNLWNSFEHHSIFSNTDKIACLEKINNSREEATLFLKNTNFLFITLGTAWIYELKNSKKIVANCHKLPAKEFQRRLLTVDEIYAAYKKLIEQLLIFNPNINIIFTVSPIRHLKDGAEANQISKSTLLLAINSIKKNYSSIKYFPSYEIVLDELRDYRFYADDFVHLTTFTVDYIWEKLAETYFSKQTRDELILSEKLTKLLQHSLMNRNEQNTKKHIQNIKNMINRIKTVNSKIDLQIAEEKIKGYENLLIK